MSEAHPTVTPAQLETDTFAVFRSLPGEPNLHLIKRVEVPRYSQPNEDGVELSRSKREQLAVQFAVTADDSHIEGPNGYTIGPNRYGEIEGEEFLVMHDVDAPMQHVQFQRNPAVAGVWDPNEEEL
jgi:hypothetical protein